MNAGKSRKPARTEAAQAAAVVDDRGEDLTGAGHTTRVVGDVPRITATVHLEG